MGVKTTLNRAAVETAATHTYFRPVEAKDAMPANPFQKVRYQVQKVARKLMDRLPGRFLGSHSGDFLQTKQQHTKEDLRKRSQYKEDDQEIECILTDESYLTDSYNRKENTAILLRINRMWWNFSKNFKNFLDSLAFIM